MSESLTNKLPGAGVQTSYVHSSTMSMYSSCTYARACETHAFNQVRARVNHVSCFTFDIKKTSHKRLRHSYPDDVQSYYLASLNSLLNMESSKPITRGVSVLNRKLITRVSRERLFRKLLHSGND